MFKGYLNLITLLQYSRIKIYEVLNCLEFMKQTSKLRKTLECIALAFALVSFSGCDSYINKVIERKEQKAKEEQLYQEMLNNRVRIDCAREQTTYNHTYEIMRNPNMSTREKRVYLDVEREMIDKYYIELSNQEKNRIINSTN